MAAGQWVGRSRSPHAAGGRGTSASQAPGGGESATAEQAAAAAAASCRGHEVLALIGDKWSIVAIYHLGTAGTLRFSELRRRVPAISQRMLTVTLRGLERDGLVSRALYPAVPPRVEYALTPLGATLLGIVQPLIEWADAHVSELDAARERYDRAAGARTADDAKGD